jgi:hypothetical protein
MQKNERFFSRWRSQQTWVNGYLILALVTIIFRNGVNYWGYDFYAIAWAKAWPEPLSVFSVENFGTIALSHILEIDSRTGWLALHLFLTLAFFVLLLFLVDREILDISGKQSLFIVILASPLSMMLMQEVGYFDVLTLIGALLMATAKSYWSQIIGAIVMASGNTPQALVGSFIFCFLVARLTPRTFKRHLLGFSPFMVVCGVWLVERLWLDGIGRTEEFGPGMWSYSFKGFLVASPLFLYSLLGPLVLLIPKIHARIGHSLRSREVQVVITFILIPGIFGIVTTESTRDSLCIMAPSLIWFLFREVLYHGLRITRWEFLGLCLLPCFLIWRQGQLIEPWSILRRVFF